MTTPRRGFLPLALITLGVIFLLGNLVPGPGKGGLIVLGIGIAFLIGRITTGRYGYSVPAGILIGIGTYISLRDIFGPQGLEGSGWFFMALGLGFGLTYLIGRPSMIWPLFPAAVLICLSLVLFGFSVLAPLASLAWIVSYWPAVLVMIGAWFLLRDRVPVGLRQPLSAIGGLALLGYGVLAAASTAAAGGAFVAGGFGPGFGLTPYADALTLEEAIGPGTSFVVNNPNGRTTIRVGNVETVRVDAKRRFSVAGQPPEVKLVPDGQQVRREVAELVRAPFGWSNRVELEVLVPASVPVEARATSGSLEIDGVRAPVRAETSSGSLKVTNVGGPAEVKATSGSITLENISGEVTASTSSGDLRGKRLQRVRQATTSSGDIMLEAIVAGPTEVRATSGDVDVKLLPGSSAQIDASSRSGDVRGRGLSLTSPTQERRALKGALGTPAADAVLTVQTTSGDIELTQ